jgi:hypothetical protein
MKMSCRSVFINAYGLTLTGVAQAMRIAWFSRILGSNDRVFLTKSDRIRPAEPE